MKNLTTLKTERKHSNKFVMLSIWKPLTKCHLVTFYSAFLSLPKNIVVEPVKLHSVTVGSLLKKCRTFHCPRKGN